MMEENIKLVLINPIFSNSYDLLIDFYKPIIGFKSCHFYMYLENEIKQKTYDLSFESIEKEIKYNKAELLSFRKNLEATDLIKTYKKDNIIYILLFGPKYPYEFLTNIKFNTLLKTCINLDEYNKLLEKYNLNLDFSNMVDVSSKFKDVFTFDIIDKECKLESKFLEIDENKVIEQIKKEIKRNLNVNIDYFSDEDFKKLYDLLSLFGFSASEIVDCSSNYLIKNNLSSYTFDYGKIVEEIKHTISFNKCFKINNSKEMKIHSDTEFALLINKYESTSPRFFLKEKQNGVDVVGADLNILYTLKDNLNLSNGVINCLIDYVLQTKDGELNANYIKKIGATLNRKNITNALDCYNYLYKNKKSSNDQMNNVKIEKEVENNDENEKQNNEVNDIFDDEESLF